VNRGAQNKNMSNLNFKTDTDSILLIDMIVTRYADLFSKLHGGQSIDRFHLMMDLTLVQNSNTPLQLRELLHTTDDNFSHDISGIINHLDRSTGELRGFFVPRYAK